VQRAFCNARAGLLSAFREVLSPHFVRERPMARQRSYEIVYNTA